MGYSALEQMRNYNTIKYGKYGIDSPTEPKYPAGIRENSLEDCALLFIRNNCEGLRFPAPLPSIDENDLKGKSAAENQIPKCMEYDLDRLCLEKALWRFFQSGTPEDAFDVYFCFIEMFFDQNTSSTKLVTLLAEFETNASSLLSSHRDHYSHSVYVFALGLAIFRQSDYFRSAYADAYGLEKDEPEAAHHFLRYWGFTALFHDIGYPFELVFDQVKTYFGGKSDAPYVTYGGFNNIQPGNPFMRSLLTDSQRTELAGRRLTPNLVFAENITDKLYDRYKTSPLIEKATGVKPVTRSDFLEYLNNLLKKKPTTPAAFGNRMDHAYFSALLLLNSFQENLANAMNPCYADVLTAILLHNLYKYSITYTKSPYGGRHALPASVHPLAYLLLLCDELQCWNRRAYGQDSRVKCYPFDCNFTFDGNQIEANYDYDKSFIVGRENTGDYKKMRRDSTGSNKFVRDIGNLVEIGSGSIELNIKRNKTAWRSVGTQYLSHSSYLHLYQFAVLLNAQFEERDYQNPKTVTEPGNEPEKQFQKLSLEYKLSNIAQAKQFAAHLDKLGYFYTDRPVCYPRVKSFTPKQLNALGRMEHERWLQEKESMGWQYGDKYEKLESNTDVQKALRERLRINKCIIDYDNLPSNSPVKDTQPMKDMMYFLEHLDGIHIYRL